MAKLKIWNNGIFKEIPFEPPQKPEEVLTQGCLGMRHPCGGNGRCGKCGVLITGEVSEPNQLEKDAGKRLSCQISLLGDAEIWTPGRSRIEQIEMCSPEADEILAPMQGKYGAAIDIGTTTLALKLYNLQDGRCVSSCSMENPQTCIAADVMGRIQASLSGKADVLKAMIEDALAQMLEEAWREAGCKKEETGSMVAAGNTTMLYLLTGQKTASLATAPFQADRLFDEQIDLVGIPTYLPPCINAFVGADISCAVLASKMCQSEEIAVLCDIGTNGEIALWKAGKLYVTSTAAGPAFEGAGISCGCGSVRGAIDRVWEDKEGLHVHTVGEAPAIGICGSGLLDAVAVGLALGEIDESGALDSDAFAISGAVKLQQQDIRAVQLAKSAIVAGMETLLLSAGVSAEQVGRLYIAGGFGSHLSIRSAAAIGLIPAVLSERVTVIGNAALAGAGQLLRNGRAMDQIRQIAAHAVHVNLGGNAVFGEKFIERMSLQEM